MKPHTRLGRALRNRYCSSVDLPGLIKAECKLLDNVLCFASLPK